MKLFDLDITNADKKYLILRDDPRFSEHKDFTENLWEKFHPYADGSFRRDIAIHFHPRFWEMYLGYTILELGFELVPKKNKMGPDLQIRSGESTIWIEATAPDAGSGKDAVPQPVIGKVNDVPKDRMLLRLTNSISQKNARLKEYLDNGIVGHEDVYILAINGFQIPHRYLENEIPFIVQSVFPFGDLSFTFDLESMAVVDSAYQYRDSITKVSGASVSTKTFLDTSFSNISGVLYSNAELWNLPATLGNDFVFVHNPNATNKLQHQWMPIGRSYWVEDNVLKSQYA